MPHLSMSDTNNMDQLPGFIQNLRTNFLKPGQGADEGRAAAPFSEIFRDIDTSREPEIPARKALEMEVVEEKRPSKTNHAEEETVSFPPGREDMAADKRPSEKVHQTEEHGGKADEIDVQKRDVKSEGAQNVKAGHVLDAAVSEEALASGLSVSKETRVPDARFSKGALLAQVPEASALTDSLKITVDVPHVATQKNEASEGLSVSEKAALNLMKQIHQTTEKVPDPTQPQTELYEENQGLMEKQTLLFREKTVTAVKSTPSPLEALQGGSVPQGMSAEGGFQEGMGQGGTFLGHSAFAQLSGLQASEGAGALQKTATDFRAVLDAGRAIPDERTILRQVAQALRAWRPGQNAPIRFLLEPKNLGTIQIDVMLQEGSLKAHMVTVNPMVKELLEGNQHFLQNALKDQGLQLDQFSVNLGDRKNFMNEERGTPVFKKTAVSSGERDGLDVLQHASQILPGGNGGLSLYV